MATTPAASGTPSEADATIGTGAPVATDPAEPRRRRKLRKRLVNVLVVLTCLSTLVTVIAFWTHATLFDTDRWMEIIGPLADDPAVTDAVAVALTDQLFQVVDVEGYAQEALPDQARFLAAPLTNAVQGFVRDGVQQLLQTDQFAQIWDRANRLAHENIVKLLQGEPVLGMTADDGTVTLNLLPLLARAMSFIDEKAPRLFGERPIPEITADTPIDQARQELSAALGRPLPEGFGVYTVLQSDQLAAAQQAVNLFDKLVWVLVVLTLALAVATIWLARNRRRTVLILALGIALAMIVANALVSAVQDQIVGLISGEAARNAAIVAIRELVSSLEVSTTFLAWIGLAVVVAAFLAGDGRTARSIRHAVASGASRARETGAAVVRDGGSGVAPVPVVAQHLGAFRAGGVVVTMLWLIVTDITWVKLALILMAFGAYQLAITVLGRATDAGPAASAP